MIFGNQGSGTLNILLTADPGFSVLLYDFDLGGWPNTGWPNTDCTISAVRVLDGTTLLFSQSGVLVAGDFVGPRRTPFAFANPLSGSQLLIEIDYSNLPFNQQDNIGIDNIRFGQSPPPDVDPPPGGEPPQTIPEPSILLLLGAGMAGSAYAHRRRGRQLAPR